MTRESEISKSVADFLQLMLNSKRIVWHDRLNSGSVCVRKKYRKPEGGFKIYDRFMHLCKVGTPDRYALLPDGSMLWIEVKRPGGIVEPDQMKFKEMIDQIPGHHYIVAKYVNDIREWFEEDH